LSSVGLKLAHIPGGDKNGADIKIIQEINDFVRTYPESTVVLLSSDKNFMPLAQSLRNKNAGVFTVVVHGKQVNKGL
jgi:uncharacterized LabA/DUF88 family protein